MDVTWCQSTCSGVRPVMSGVGLQLILRMGGCTMEDLRFTPPDTYNFLEVLCATNVEESFWMQSAYGSNTLFRVVSGTLEVGRHTYTARTNLVNIILSGYAASWVSQKL